MILYPPVKYASPRNLFKNIKLESLSDFNRCITQVFGVKSDIYKQFGIIGHNGIDIAIEEGTEIFASHDGTVSFTQDSNGGLGAVIATKTHKSLYWHLQSFVGAGRTIKRGDLIGYGDSTGFSTGHHLHWGLKLLDENGDVKSRDNGYDGAVDCMDYLVWYNDPMSKEEVRNLYRLAFYREPTDEESNYWLNKPLADFLKTAIADRAKFLEQT